MSASAASAADFGDLFTGVDEFARLHKAHQDVHEAPDLKTLLKADHIHALSIQKRLSSAGIETTKFQHYFRGLEVIGSMAIHHRTAKGTQVRNRVSEFDLETSPTLSEGDAIALAQTVAGVRALEKRAELKILPSDENSASLIYQISLESDGLDQGRDILIDAHSGQILANLAHEMEIAPIQILSAKKQGWTWIQGFDSRLPGYDRTVKGCRVTDLATGRISNLAQKTCETLAMNQCQLLDSRGRPFFLNPAKCPKVISTAGSKLTADTSATNAAYNSQLVLNYFQSRHGRNSFDGKGSPAVSIIHAGLKFDNAFWNPKQNIMVYGDGDGKEFGDFSAAVDVAGHEMTHGVTSQTADLIYMGESGALNEAYSDLFGKLIEGKGDWLVGRGMFLSDKNKGIRDMSNPHSVLFDGKRPYPAHTREKLPNQATCDGSNDNCWVHINSMIPGHASYLVVQAIGVQKAEKLYYITLTQNLTSKETFKSAKEATMGTCGQLFDAGTCGKVEQAFAKVGL